MAHAVVAYTKNVVYKRLISKPRRKAHAVANMLHYLSATLAFRC